MLPYGMIEEIKIEREEIHNAKLSIYRIIL